MQTSIKPEKMQTKKLRKLNDKEQEELAIRHQHKGKHHKTQRGKRPEWEAY